MTPPSSPRFPSHVLERGLLALLVCTALSHAVWTLSSWRPEPPLLYWMADGLMVLALALGGALAWCAAARCVFQGSVREAVAWRMFALAQLAWAAGESYYLKADLQGGEPPFPGWSDLGFLLFPPLVALALLYLPRARFRPYQAASFALDIMIVLITLTAVFWKSFMAQNIAANQANLFTLVVAQAYPVSDLLLFAVLLTVLLWRPTGAAGLPLLPFSLGVALFFSADTYYALLTAQDRYVNGNPGDALWTLAGLAFGLAAFTAQRPLGRWSGVLLRWLDGSGAFLRVLPYVSVAASYTLLTASTEQRGLEGVGVLLGALIVTALVLARQFMALRENRRLSERLSHEASHDALTGLLNRAALMRATDQAAARAAEQGSVTALLFCDLDKFKAVNDTLGHAAGDDLLRQVAARLRRSVREHDTIARLGGDEFVLLLTDLDDPSFATVLAERIVRAVEQPFVVSGQDVQIGVSLGVTLLPRDAASASEALRNADLALYAVKERGRNGYALFDALLADQQRDRTTLERDLRGAVERGELSLVYQPQYRARTGELRGFEALVRWQHPVRGALSPGVFIPIAEEAGFISELGCWVLEEAARQAALWRGDLGGLTLSVNVSALEFTHPNFIGRVRAALAHAALLPGTLTLEVTETGVVGDVDLARAKLSELRSMGVRVSLDDFGTGYSSLSSLRALSADELKLDRSFTLDLASGSAAKATSVFEAVVHLAHGLGMSVMAEGIETPEQLALVAQCGADDVQGFHLSMPLSAAEAHSLMRRRLALLA